MSRRRNDSTKLFERMEEELGMDWRAPLEPGRMVPDSDRLIAGLPDTLTADIETAMWISSTYHTRFKEAPLAPTASVDRAVLRVGCSGKQAHAWTKIAAVTFEGGVPICGYTKGSSGYTPPATLQDLVQVPPVPVKGSLYSHRFKCPRCPVDWIVKDANLWTVAVCVLKAGSEKLDISLLQ